VADAWFRDPEAWRFIGRRYLPWLAGLQLAWEVAQVPLYTIWYEASRVQIAFAVAHCTAGDALIGLGSLVVALVLGRERSLGAWRWRRIVAWLLLLGPAYTIFSEWLNTSLLRWTYSELMPTFMGVGLAPIAQWLVAPPLALHFARKAAR
jgi:hypothetical protein